LAKIELGLSLTGAIVKCLIRFRGVDFGALIGHLSSQAFDLPVSHSILFQVAEMEISAISGLAMELSEGSKRRKLDSARHGAVADRSVSTRVT